MLDSQREAVVADWSPGLKAGANIAEHVRVDLRGDEAVARDLALGAYGAEPRAYSRPFPARLILTIVSWRLALGEILTAVGDPDLSVASHHDA